MLYACKVYSVVLVLGVSYVPTWEFTDSNCQAKNSLQEALIHKT